MPARRGELLQLRTKRVEVGDALYVSIRQHRLQGQNALAKARDDGSDRVETRRLLERKLGAVEASWEDGRWPPGAAKSLWVKVHTGMAI